MSDYKRKVRRRNQTLLIVEGNHEKNKLFWLIFQCFPELNIDMDNVWIYGTNIYLLYDDIVGEYGDKWAEEELDIDLPFVISKKRRFSPLRYKDDFTNIVLIFDYERHDPKFSEKRIMDLQNSFSDMADMGQLYLNYPMIESYQHLHMIPDLGYLESKIPVSLQPGYRYKEVVGNESFVKFVVEFPHRLDDLLNEHYGIKDESLRRKCCEKIFEIFDVNDLEDVLWSILKNAVEERRGKTLIYQLTDWISKVGYVYDGKSYWKHTRWLFAEIIYHNIWKAHYIQTNQREIDGNTYKTCFDELEMDKILGIQNSSSNGKDGFIWVLNTCVFLVAEYNFALLQR